MSELRSTTIRLTDNEKQALLDLATQHGPAYENNLSSFIRGIAHGSIRLANQDKMLARIEALERQQQRDADRLTDFMLKVFHGGDLG